MSLYIDQIKNEKDLPVTYSINIKTLSTSKRPLTCYITTIPRISKQRGTNQLNRIRSSTCLDKTNEYRLKSTENNHRSSIHLPITYSSSIHIPCHPSTITLRSPTILPTQSSHHHYHYYHHHYYHHHRQSLLSSRPSPTIKHKISPQPTSIGSTRPTTTSTTNTSPDSLLPSRKRNKLIPTPPPITKQPTHPPPPPLPSYSTLVWNWFHHTPTKTQSHHKGSQSDYSETYRHELPSKRSLLFNLLTSPSDKQSKSKHHRTCFTRKRFESSSSLPNKINNYNE